MPSSLTAQVHHGTNPTRTHKVVLGDSLSKIAKDNHLSLIDLEAANPSLRNPNLILPGQTIKIPLRPMATSTDNRHALTKKVSVIVSSKSAPAPLPQVIPTPSFVRVNKNPTPILPAPVQAKMETIKPAAMANMPIYEQAEKITGVPKEVAAGIHYREANNNPKLDLQAGNPIGKVGGQYTSRKGAQPDLLTSVINADNDLQAAALNGRFKVRIDVANPNLDVIADAMLSYNGRASAYAAQAAQVGADPKTEPYKGSPYVENDLTPVQMNMGIIKKDHGGIDGHDARPGALTVAIGLGLKEGTLTTPNLAEPTPVTPNTLLADTLAIGQKIAKLAVDFGGLTTGKGKELNDATPAYQKAYTAVGMDHSNQGPTDCGEFTATVVISSGHDDQFPKRTTWIQEDHMAAHPEKYLPIANKGITADLQPGDIAVNPSHTFIYTGPLDNKHDTEAASHTEHVPEPSNVFFSENGVPFRIFRPIDNSATSKVKPSTLDPAQVAASQSPAPIPLITLPQPSKL